MSDNANTTGTSPASTSMWVFAVIGLVAIIGLLSGLLISKTTAPDPVVQTTQVQQTTPPSEGPPGAEPGADADVRRILRNLDRTRRREILQQAMKSIEGQDIERPRVLMQKRRQARQKMLETARTEPYDPIAMRKALDEMHAVNAKMAAQGTELTLAVLERMTPEERKAATRRPTRQERRQKRRDRRRD